MNYQHLRNRLSDNIAQYNILRNYEGFGLLNMEWTQVAAYVGEAAGAVFRVFLIRTLTDFLDREMWQAAHVGEEDPLRKGLRHFALGFLRGFGLL